MKIKRIIGFAFATTLLFGGLTALSFAQPQNEIIVEEANAWSLDVQPSVTADYYSSCDGKTGSALKTALAAINKPQSPNYDWSRYEAADEAQDDSTSVLCIYTRHNIQKSFHVGSSYAWDKWNREHVYTQSDFPNSDKDNHNIFACEGQINNYRGNLKFAEGGERLTVFGHLTDCYKTKDTFEPCDDAKGEIARACMYCTIYYGYTLPQIFDSVDTCIKWHVQHPVTPREIYRNNVVYGLQGNRNPFVDHPSYANTIWNTSYTYSDPDPVGGEPADPVAVTGVSLNKTSLNLEVGQTSTLTATVAPSNATNKKVTWSTGNSSIATVNNGVVTAVSAGETSITVTTADGGFVANCPVVVTPKTTPTPTVYTVTFDSKGGSTVASKQVESGQTVAKPADPTREGYTFDGWYLGDNAYNFNSPVTGNITLVAQWTPVDDGGQTTPPDDGGQTTPPDDGGGEDTPAVITAKLDTTKALEITPPSKVKYSAGEQIDLTGFKAIATYEDGSKKDVTDKVVLDAVNMNKVGDKIVTLSYTEDGRTVRGLFNISVVAASAAGCHGSIIASSAIISLTSLLGLGLLLLKKKQ